VRLTAILFVCGLIVSSGCSSQSTDQPTPASSQSTPASSAPNAANSNAIPSASIAPVAKVKIDACSLLTSAEIQAVQGEPVKETKLSEHTSGGFITTQCYYALPTAANAISLTLTESSIEKPSIREFWERTFAKDEGKSERERKQERDKEKKMPRAQPESRREGEEEESAPLDPVPGVGDEAFWSASRVGGALFVLKRDRYLRISVGGAGDVQAKLKKSKVLALKALQRL
jgi:hypothetical protein